MMLRLLLGLLVLLGPRQAAAWGHAGHENISALAMQALPAELPEALRSPEAARLVAALGPELDLSKGAGQAHDAELDPGHYLDLDDNGLVFGVLALDALPPTREAFDTAMRAGGYTQYRAGYLYYALLGGWQQLRRDFGWIRAAAAGVDRATTEEDRAFFQQLLQHRTAVALQDLGRWSHYVADASQPLHVSVHFNGWGNHPNPRGFSTDRTLHARFEGGFVRSQVRWPAVAAAMPAPRDCGCPLPARLRQYLLASQAQVVPLYELEQRGGFGGAASAEGRDFVTARLAAGAAELRDLVVLAWRESASEKVGYPPQPVAEMAAGRLAMHRGMFWRD